jgi:hypothetical protein
MSQVGQQATSTYLFDQLVGASEKRSWDRYADYLCGLEVDDVAASHQQTMVLTLVRNGDRLTEALANVRFGAHNGLGWDIAPCPKSALKRHCYEGCKGLFTQPVTS